MNTEFSEKFKVINLLKFKEIGKTNIQGSYSLTLECIPNVIMQRQMQIVYLLPYDNTSFNATLYLLIFIIPLNYYIEFISFFQALQ